MASRSQADKSYRTEVEERYRKDVEAIAYEQNINFKERDGAMYLVSEDEEVLFLTPMKPNRIWYETWYKLKFDKR